ncbi:hypothetical protein ACXZ66_09290 [Corynebacterium sp. S7]
MTTALASPVRSASPGERLEVYLQLVRSKAGNSATPWKGTPSAERNPELMLSRDFSCALVDHEGLPLAHNALGTSGLSIRKAWDLAASQLLYRHSFSEGTEFLVRDARLRSQQNAVLGLEVSFKHSPAAAWLAHPYTFSVLHQHFHNLVRPAKSLVYATTDQLDLFVFDAHPHELSATFESEKARMSLIVYSLGFPLSR